MSRGDFMTDEIESFHEDAPRMSVGLDDEGYPMDVTGIEDTRRDATQRRMRSSPSGPGVSFTEFGSAFVDDEADEDDGADVYGEMDQLIGQVFGSDIGDNNTTRNLRLLQDQGEDGGRQSLVTDEDGNTTFQFVFPDATKSRLSIYDQKTPTLAKIREPTLKINTPEEELPLAEDYDLPDQSFGGDFGADSDVNDDFQGFADQGDSDVDEIDMPLPIIHEEDTINEPSRLSSSRLSTSTFLRPAAQVSLKKTHVSKHGISYPSLPTSLVKKMAIGFAKSAGTNGQIGRDAIVALSEASNWFFEQVSDDLAAFATHARRKGIEESDVITLMKRYVSASLDH
jgi:histone H3/H4